MVDVKVEIDFFDGMGREPQPDEIQAMICQTNKYFTDTIQELMQDTNAVSYATNIDWKYDTSEGRPVQIFFLSHTTNGQGTLVPAATMYDYILTQFDFETMVKKYIWNSEPYPTNVFFQTEDILVAGSMSGKGKGRSPITWKLEQASC